MTTCLQQKLESYNLQRLINEIVRVKFDRFLSLNSGLYGCFIVSEHSDEDDEKLVNKHLPRVKEIVGYLTGYNIHENRKDKNGEQLPLLRRGPG